MFFSTEFIIFAVLAAASIGRVMAKVGDCSRHYTVKKGDICDIISAAQNVSTYQLAQVNKGRIDAGCDNLKPDEILCLGVEGQDCSTTYVVQLGDTCNAIIDATGVDKDTLLANNPNLNATSCFIYGGEVLCTAKDEVHYTNSPKHCSRMTYRKRDTAFF